MKLLVTRVPVVSLRCGAGWGYRLTSLQFELY